MNRITLGVLLSLSIINVKIIAQEVLPPAERIMSEDKKLQIGGYAQIDYNQPFANEIKNNGKLDVHRLVMLFGYRFNSKTQFITEIEFEHVSEVYIEQAFLEYKINQFINFRGGLVLIPMGIINEYHEPPTYNGVERPNTDSKIAPTTWRELGAGFSGNIIDASIRYQAYVVNGFNGYDGDARLNGKNGLRGGRQKGAESYISSPNFTSKIEYYGLPHLNLGFSGYFGKTQSTAYNGIDKTNSAAMESADSSVVGVSMFGADARFDLDGIQLKGQFYFTKLSNTSDYNAFTANADGTLNDLGSVMTGYYVEAAYNVFHALSRTETQLVPFVRYENYNTHSSTTGDSKNDSYNNNFIITGLGWKITPGAMLKADIQFGKSKADSDFSKVFNAGVAVMF